MVGAIAAVGAAGFVAGVMFSKTVLSEASAIKQHVTAELKQLRQDLAGELSAAAKKI